MRPLSCRSRYRLLPGRVLNGYRNMYTMGHHLGVGCLMAQMHVGPQPAVDGVVLHHCNNDPADDRAINLARSTLSEPCTGRRPKPVYALAAAGATHFQEEVCYGARGPDAGAWRGPR